jgi:hypothetical protein
MCSPGHADAYRNSQGGVRLASMVVGATFDLSGRMTVSIEDPEAGVERFVANQMDPFVRRATPGRPSDVVLEATLRRDGPLLDIQNPARDATVTASDGERFYVLVDGRACVVPNPIRDRPVRFSYEPGFPVRRIYAALVRPAMHVGLMRRDAVAVHSAAVEMDGRAVLIAGWSESGKTETALALLEAGARFVSDKWSVLGTDGEVSAFPINVGVRRWALAYLPSLRAALPGAARAQLAVAGIAAAVSRPARERVNPGRAAMLATRAVALADRAALTPTELRAAYRQADDPTRRVALGTTAILTTVPGPEVVCEPADSAWAAARLARSAAFERRELFAMLERRRYAFPRETENLIERAIAEETRLLERALGSGQTLELRAPFPVDPRTVAEALMRRL